MTVNKGHVTIVNDTSLVSAPTLTDTVHEILRIVDNSHYQSY